MHKKIKRFSLQGTMQDNNKAASLKETYLGVLKDQMCGEGYALMLDLDTDYTVQYNGTTYDFEISIYGTFVGKKQAKCMDGIYGARGVYTPSSKSDMLLAQQA